MRDAVPTPLFHAWAPHDVEAVLRRVDDAEGDDMGSCGGQQQAPRGRGPAIEPPPGQVLASVCGQRQADGFWQWQGLWAPCGIPREDPAHGGAYPRQREATVHYRGQRTPQQSERTPLT